VLPITRPLIENACVEVDDDGRIAGVGAGSRPDAIDLGHVALLPGLVNAHTHLELSWMAGLVPPSATMDEWIRTLLRVRRAGPPGGPAAEARAAREAAQAMRDTGTLLVGDISNGLGVVEALADASLGGVIFHELLGFDAKDPVGMVREAWGKETDIGCRFLQSTENCKNRHPMSVSFSVVAHAPYSVSPALMTEIAKRRRQAPLAIHLGESAEEIEFLRTGRGPIRLMLEDLGVWPDEWAVPRCDPVEYLHRLGYLQPGLLAVHAAHLTDDALARLRRARAVVVTCPRSNAWVGAGVPRLSHFYATGVAVAIGTDSLASAPTLSLWDELHEMRRLAPDVTAAALLHSATRQGALALGFGADYGSIETGRRAELLAVDIPAGISDVEEYLVSGVPSGAVRWARS
jgi:cytosine/adenosine deaminase-related metal-dependent hydrolase